MANRIILETFQADAEDKHFEVEYLDTNGQWSNAAGGWKDGESVRHMYDTSAAAKLAARSLRKTHSYTTRVIQVHS